MTLIEIETTYGTVWMNPKEISLITDTWDGRADVVLKSGDRFTTSRLSAKQLAELVNNA